MGCATQKQKKVDMSGKQLDVQSFPSIWEPNKDIQVFQPKPFKESSSETKDQLNEATEIGLSRTSYRQPKNKEFSQQKEIFVTHEQKRSLKSKQKSLLNKKQFETQTYWYYEPTYPEGYKIKKTQNSRIVVISLEALEKD